MAKIDLKSKDTKLKIFAFENLFDIEKLIINEPELFDELCNDYPLDDGVYMLVKKGSLPK